ncbi:MAG: hypothetical protein KC561_17695, partial [Myxococcales bacterium]|nr:hypothetical protein [Myxococcales bacterium]
GKKSALLMLWLLLSVSFLACAEEDTDAIVDVRWGIGGTTCSRMGLTRVYVSLVTNGRSVANAEADCSAETVAVEGVAKGRYTVQVFAFRANEDTPAFVGQEAGVEVPKGGRVSTSVIFLEEAPGAVDVTWRFESGNICAFEGVGWIEVSAFDDRNRVVADFGIACDPGVDPSTGLGGPGSEYLEDAQGVVIDYLFEGTHEILLRGYERATDDEPGWGGSGQVEVRSFELTPVDIVLQPCEDAPESVCF